MKELSKIINFIWTVADDILRDVYVKGKYRDVILPMTVIRRLDCLLEPTKDQVLNTFKTYKNKLDNLDGLLSSKKNGSGHVFYNYSPFTLTTLLNEPKKIKVNFENYLNGFSDNVQEIINKFKFRNQIETLDDNDLIFLLIEKFTSKTIDLHPDQVSNLEMGYIFEDLIRRFNEQNNEEAGEHFTPREIIQLMTNIVFMPIKNELRDGGTYLVYDPACGSGGMLTEAKNFITDPDGEIQSDAQIHLYGQEINPETYAICKSDMLIKEEDPDKIAYGSTLKNDGFNNLEFDFMLTNPPYGKSWKSDKREVTNEHKMDEGKEYSDFSGRFGPGLPRINDGQMLFDCNMLAKMKKDSKLGSRIASVHNGSALFTGDAGSGESNIRKWMIESDWLEAIVALPTELFYNTGIPTYIWVFSNRKSEERQGRIQLLNCVSDDFYQKMKKSLGSKRNELTANHINLITREYLDFKETEFSKIFDNNDFGYSKITVERPLRLSFQITDEKMKEFKETQPKINKFADILFEFFDYDKQDDFNLVKKKFEKELKSRKIKSTKTTLNKVYSAFTSSDEEAEKVIKKKLKDGSFEYEPDADLRDYEKIPLKDDIQEYFEKEVLPCVPDAWIDHSKTKIGYEINFNKYFFKFEKEDSLEDITREIEKLQEETEVLLESIIRA